MLIYPQLRGAQLVGTDLVQAVPLVASARSRTSSSETSSWV
jgi:hypothetical protein